MVYLCEVLLAAGPLGLGIDLHFAVWGRARVRVREVLLAARRDQSTTDSCNQLDLTNQLPTHWWRLGSCHGSCGGWVHAMVHAMVASLRW